MALAVSVGAVAEMLSIDEEAAAEHRALLDQLSAALADKGVDWREPDDTAVPPMGPHLAGFPYSCLHQLRRVLVLLRLGEPVTPVSSDEELDRDEHKINDVTSQLDSHLLCHSDCEGFYVPVDFGDPLFLDEHRVPGGGVVGSSHGLLKDLLLCAPPLGISLDDGALTTVEAERLLDLPDDADFAIESMVWLTLYEACRVSIDSGHAIVFQ